LRQGRRRQVGARNAGRQNPASTVQHTHARFELLANLRDAEPAARARRIAAWGHAPRPAGEVKDLRREAQALKEVVADLTLESRLLKKALRRSRSKSSVRILSPARSGLHGAGITSVLESRVRIRFSLRWCEGFRLADAALQTPVQCDRTLQYIPLGGGKKSQKIREKLSLIARYTP
jgi:hypothetical protein